MKLVILSYIFATFAALSAFSLSNNSELSGAPHIRLKTDMVAGAPHIRLKTDMVAGAPHIRLKTDIHA
ncbi:hypothetical protein [Shewanella colwelliana]|uniref:hypothetical protein n=1 Tax=Shewanella colwelliana TaxID=23 RepID=UPI0022AFE084|nr:hypothetical protein [Shewanella colwelliana]MCZ4337806.1 hypothetical protein [Shewanella colwelliana]